MTDLLLKRFDKLHDKLVLLVEGCLFQISSKFFSMMEYMIANRALIAGLAALFEAVCKILLLFLCLVVFMLFHVSGGNHACFSMFSLLFYFSLVCRLGELIIKF